MKISFFKTGKPKEFSYRPLYYNERKEELEKIKQMAGDQSEVELPERLRIKLQHSWHDRHNRRRGKTPVSNIRLLVYLAALALFIYFIFFARIF